MMMIPEAYRETDLPPMIEFTGIGIGPASIHGTMYSAVSAWEWDMLLP